MNEASAEVIPYEDRFDAHHDWGMNQGSRHFSGESDVWRSLRRVARRLDDLGVRYAAIGAIALFLHGYRRFTTDVDLIVTADGLEAIHARLDDLGCVRPDPARKSVRDIETGVRFDLFVTGKFPGDGQPKPVAFPDPAESSVTSAGITHVNLPTFLDLNLASGMTGGLRRMKDLANVVGLIKARSLPANLADQLDPFVRARYLEIWRELQTPDPHDLA